MRYYKLIEDGYLTAIGTGNGGISTTEEEYNSLLEHIHNKPEAEEGYGYRLKEDLTWELYELPIVPEEEISSDELMTMIEGVL
jgi:hypothetical protein